MKYHFNIKRQGRGHWAESVELKGCHSQGETLATLRENLREALNLYLSEPEGSKILFPEPKKRVKLSRNVIAIEVDPKIAFAISLRNLRLKKSLTQSEMKDRLGIKHLSAYQRLEDPTRANPRLLTLKRIKQAFPSLSLDKILAA